MVARESNRPLPVGSRAGAVLRRSGLAVAPRFLWECLSSPTVSPFPTPATSVGSRAGAVPRRSGLSGAPCFLWECLASPTVSPSPAPATSNRAGGFPAPGSPARFTPRVMGPTATAALSAATNPRLLHLARPDQPSPERISPVSGLAESGCFSQGTPASRVDEGITSSRAPSLRGHYPASSLLRTHPPPSRRQPTSRCCRLYGLPRFRPFGSGRGGLLQLPNVSWSSCRR